MTSNMDFLRTEAAPATLRVAVNAWGCAVAVTAQELLIVKSGVLFWKKKLERYRLADVRGAALRPNPNADILSVELRDGRSLSMLFSEPQEREGAARLAELLDVSTKAADGVAS